MFWYIFNFFFFKSNCQFNSIFLIDGRLATSKIVANQCRHMRRDCVAQGRRSCVGCSLVRQFQFNLLHSQNWFVCLLFRLEAGDVFGELSFLIGGEAPASIVVTSGISIQHWTAQKDLFNFLFFFPSRSLYRDVCWKTWCVEIIWRKH